MHETAIIVPKPALLSQMRTAIDLSCLRVVSGLYDFDSSGNGELSIAAGEVLLELQVLALQAVAPQLALKPSLDGWSLCVRRDAVRSGGVLNSVKLAGYVPSSYLCAASSEEERATLSLLLLPPEQAALVHNGGQLVGAKGALEDSGARLDSAHGPMAISTRASTSGSLLGSEAVELEGDDAEVEGQAVVAHAAADPTASDVGLTGAQTDDDLLTGSIADAVRQEAARMRLLPSAQPHAEDIRNAQDCEEEGAAAAGSFHSGGDAWNGLATSQVTEKPLMYFDDASGGDARRLHSGRGRGAQSEVLHDDRASTEVGTDADIQPYGAELQASRATDRHAQSAPQPSPASMYASSCREVPAGTPSSVGRGTDAGFTSAQGSPEPSPGLTPFSYASTPGGRIPEGFRTAEGTPQPQPEGKSIHEAGSSQPAHNEQQVTVEQQDADGARFSGEAPAQCHAAVSVPGLPSAAVDAPYTGPSELAAKWARSREERLGVAAQAPTSLTTTAARPRVPVHRLSGRAAQVMDELLLAEPRRLEEDEGSTTVSQSSIPSSAHMTATVTVTLPSHAALPSSSTRLGKEYVAQDQPTHSLPIAGRSLTLADYMKEVQHARQEREKHLAAIHADLVAMPGHQGVPSAVSLRTMRMLYDFTAEGTGELSVQAGEFLQRMDDQAGTPDGWLLVEHTPAGSNEPVRGYVPSSYVEDCEAGSEDVGDAVEEAAQAALHAATLLATGPGGDVSESQLPRAVTGWHTMQRLDLNLPAYGPIAALAHAQRAQSMDLGGSVPDSTDAYARGYWDAVRDVLAQRPGPSVGADDALPVGHSAMAFGRSSLNRSGMGSQQPSATRPPAADVAAMPAEPVLLREPGLVLGTAYRGAAERYFRDSGTARHVKSKGQA